LTAGEPLEIAVEMAGILERLDVRYVLGGSLASVTFGEPRATLDVDIAADLQGCDVPAFVTATEREYFVDRAWVEDESQSTPPAAPST
jgi:hypothetical protein